MAQEHLPRSPTPPWRTPRVNRSRKRYMPKAESEPQAQPPDKTPVTELRLNKPLNNRSHTLPRGRQPRTCPAQQVIIEQWKSHTSTRRRPFIDPSSPLRTFRSLTRMILFANGFSKIIHVLDTAALLLEHFDTNAFQTNQFAYKHCVNSSTRPRRDTRKTCG